MHSFETGSPTAGYNYAEDECIREAYADFCCFRFHLDLEILSDAGHCLGHVSLGLLSDRWNGILDFCMIDCY